MLRLGSNHCSAVAPPPTHANMEYYDYTLWDSQPVGDDVTVTPPPLDPVSVEKPDKQLS